MKIINCVYTRNKLDFKKYSKNSDNHDIVSFHDIITKLVKNDINSNKPSTLVINSYIRKRLIKALTDDDVTKILYALKNLNVDTIDYIKDLINDVYEGKIKYNLIIVKNKKLNINLNDDFANCFNTIKYEKLKS